jgi:hypothetical protein
MDHINPFIAKYLIATKCIGLSDAQNETQESHFPPLSGDHIMIGSQIIPTIVCNVHRAYMYDIEIIRKRYDTFVSYLYVSRILRKLQVV